jgi:hypothetical protein
MMSACGGDEGGAPAGAKPPTPAGGGAANKKGGKAAKELKPMRRIEDRVSCPTPSDAKKCDPKAPLCSTGQYCLAAGKDFYCGVCPERDAIRHVFKPRDFSGPDMRDPFQSFVIPPSGLGGPAVAEGEGRVVTQKCVRKDQFQATSFNYQQLKLVGIVAQGTQRKVLVMGGNLGYILKKGDCVGKEKAVVKDVGPTFVTFQVEASGKNAPFEYSMQLYPTAVSMNSPDADDPGAASTPIVAPPSQVTAPDRNTTQPQGPTTTIIQDKPSTTTTTVPPPSQAPTQLKP